MNRRPPANRIATFSPGMPDGGHTVPRVTWNHFSRPHPPNRCKQGRCSGGPFLLETAYFVPMWTGASFTALPVFTDSFAASMISITRR